MAKTFQMGAKMTLKDQFKSTISKITQSTMDFKRSIENTNKSINTVKNSTGRLRDETGKFVSSGNKASVAARTWFNSNGKLTSSLSFVAKGAGAAAAAFSLWKAKNWLIDGNADMETYQNTLSVVLKDQKKAVEMLGWAEKFAAKTPFEIPQIVEATTKLSAYGINAQKTLSIIGDMASVTGKDLMQAVEAVSDAVVSGELERMKEFGITKKMIEDQAKLMKVQVINNKGQITDQKAFSAVMFKLMDERFKGGMEMQSKTFKGMISNAKDFVGSLGRQLGKPIFEKAKEGLGSLLAWLNKLQENGSIDKFIVKVQQVGAVVGRVFTNSFAVARQNVMMVASKMAQFYRDNKPKIDAIGIALQNAFQKLSDFATPIILWLRNVGLPLVVDALMKVGGWVLDIANWFINNWKPISPIVYGIVGALVAYKVAMVGIVVAQKAAMIIEALSKAWRVASAVLAMFQAGASLATVAQWALNAAMTANPVGVIVVAIGALIAIIVLLVKNWDTVKGALIKGAQAVGSFFVRIWNAIKSPVLAVFNVIKAAFMVVFTVIKTYVMIWLAIFKVIFTIIKTVVLVVWNVIKFAFIVLFLAVKAYIMLWLAIFKAVFNAIKTVILFVWNAIKGPAFAVFNAIKAVVMTVFEAAKNIVMTFVTVVTSVIGGIVGVFKSVFNTVWNIISTVVGWIKGAFEGVGKAISTVFNGIIAVVKAPVNFLIGAINSLIKGINSLKVDIPDWVPLVGGKSFGMNLPEIPYLAKGTKNWPGGPAFMNERGGELAILPGGSQVIPADKTDKILDRPGGGNVTITNHITINQQPGEDGESLAARVLDIMYEKLSNAAEIANNAEMGVLLGT